MNFADSYVTHHIQALDELIKNTKRPEIANWGKLQRIHSATSIYTNATNPSAAISVVDLALLATLRRMAIEDHWIPMLLHEEGAGLLDSAKRGESEGWALASVTLTPEQIVELKDAIGAWKAEHKDQYYVGWVRLSDIASAKQIRSSSSLAKRGSLLGLLFLDPLAGLDPVAQELRSYRALSERLMFLLLRLPTIFSWQADVTIAAAIDTPETRKLIDATSRFADTTAGIPKTFTSEREAIMSQMSEMISHERDAAITQLNSRLTEQREGFMRDLDAQQAKLDGLIGSTRTTLADVKSSANAVGATATNTLTTADELARRTVDAIRNAVIVIVVVISIVPALVILLFRAADRRMRRNTHDRPVEPEPIG